MKDGEESAVVLDQPLTSEPAAEKDPDEEEKEEPLIVAEDILPPPTGFLEKDLPEYLDSIKNLTSIECSALKSKMESDMTQYMYVHEVVDALKSESENADPELQTALEVEKENKIDELSEQFPNLGFEDIINDPNTKGFMRDYDENIRVMNQILDALNERIRAAEEKKSDRFYTDEMLLVLNKQLNNLNMNDLNYEYRAKKIRNGIEGFQRRLSLNYVANKAAVYAKNKSTKKDLRKVLTSKNPLDAAIKGLRKSFTKEQCQFAAYILNIIFQKNAVLIIMAILSKINITEMRTGKNVWAKVVITNLNDIGGQIFDIGDANAYMTALWRELGSSVNSILNQPVGTEFGLLQPHLKWVNNAFDAKSIISAEEERRAAERAAREAAEKESSEEITDDSAPEKESESSGEEIPTSEESEE